MSHSTKGNCNSCLMPFSKDPKGVDREHELHCSYCFTNGELTYKGDDVKGFKKSMIDAMVSQGHSKMKAKFFSFLAGFAPRWKK